MLIPYVRPPAPESAEVPPDRRLGSMSEETMLRMAFWTGNGLVELTRGKTFKLCIGGKHHMMTVAEDGLVTFS